MFGLLVGWKNVTGFEEERGFRGGEFRGYVFSRPRGRKAVGGGGGADKISGVGRGQVGPFVRLDGTVSLSLRKVICVSGTHTRTAVFRRCRRLETA